MTSTPETMIKVDLRIDDSRILDRVAEVAIETDQSICDDVGEVVPLYAPKDLVAFIQSRSTSAQGLKLFRFDDLRRKTDKVVGILRELGLAYEVAVTTPEEEVRRYWMPGFKNEIRVRLIDDEVVHSSEEIDGIMAEGPAAWQNYQTDLATALAHEFSIDVPANALKPTAPAPRP
jgi:hypothetical protein